MLALRERQKLKIAIDLLADRLLGRHLKALSGEIVKTISIGGDGVLDESADQSLPLRGVILRQCRPLTAICASNDESNVLRTAGDSAL